MTNRGSTSCAARAGRARTQRDPMREIVTGAVAVEAHFDLWLSAAGLNQTEPEHASPNRPIITDSVEWRRPGRVDPLKLTIAHYETAV